MSARPTRSDSTGDFRARYSRGAHGRIGRIEKARDPRTALLRLVPYLAIFKWRLLLVMSLIVIGMLLGLAGPYFMGRAIDNFIIIKDLSGLALTALLLAGIYLLDALFELIASWIMATVSQHSLMRLRRDLFKHLQALPLKFFDTHPTGELMSRLTNDIDAINQAVSQNVISLAGSLLTLIGVLTAMFVLNVRLALASLFVIPIMIGFARFVASYTRRGFRELQKNLGDLNAVLEESISGQRVVQAFRRNESIQTIFQECNKTVYRSSITANSYALLLMPLTGVLGNFFVIVLAGAGGWLALDGYATIGMIVTFISYARLFVAPLRQLAHVYNSLQGALAGAERVFNIMDEENEGFAQPDPIAGSRITGSVRFRDVNFGYLPDVPVLKRMNLDAQPGETIALVGPTGAGKTTLVNLLSRFYEIDSGIIEIDGRDIRSYRKEHLRQQLGVVLQDTFLFSSTVMENIRFGRLDATDEECINAAIVADAHHFIRQLPDGYATELSERAGNLSQGQRQLLAITRAILADPAILILDEATSSVDTRTELRIQSALLRLMKGRTSFVIAHRLSTIREADQLLVIDNGEIIERGTHETLLKAKGFYYQMYMSQFAG